MNLAKYEYRAWLSKAASAGRLFNASHNLLRTALSQLLNPMNPAFLPEPTGIRKTILLVNAYRKHFARWPGPVKRNFPIRICGHFRQRAEPWQRISKLLCSTNCIQVNGGGSLIGSDAQVFDFREEEVQSRL